MQGAQVEIDRQIVEAVRRARATMAEVARHDPHTFATFILKDEETGEPIEEVDFHAEWHDLIRAHARVALWSSPELGKSQQISIAHSLWELGCDPSLRIVIISKTTALSKAIIATMKHLIESSEEVHMVFPKLRRETRVAREGMNITRAPWTAQKLTIERPVFSKDASIQAYGQGSKGITGSRIDILILDDILTDDNTSTKKQRDKLWNWLQSTVLDRMSRRGKIIIMGNAWHPDDAMHRLVKASKYASGRYPAVDANGEPTFTRRWTKERIAQARIDLGPREAKRKLELVPFDESEKRFKRETVARCTKEGRGYSVVDRLIDPKTGFSTLPPGFVVYHGVDLSTGVGRDYSAIVSLLWHPTQNKRQVLSIRRGKWVGPEIIKQIDDVSARYGGIFIVENNATQQYILQFAEKLTPATLKGFATGKNKADPMFGLESLSAEFDAGRWIVPSEDGTIEGVTDPEIIDWLAQMDEYQPGQHPGDSLMASWFAREGIRAHEARIAAATKRRDSGARVFSATAA